MLAAGDIEDHATLLCSLLLGLGLDAFVAIGTRIDSAGIESDHAWVVAREQTTPAATSTAEYQAVFWEPLSGLRGTPSEVAPSGHRYARIHCLFNDVRYFANHRLDDRVESAGWDVMDVASWKMVRHSRIFGCRIVCGVSS